MYLKRIFIKDNGPLRDISLELPFDAEGAPQPVVLVGCNGSGKTSLLSTVADALILAAAQHYQDIVPLGPGLHMPFFRTVGGATISHGASASFSSLEFEHNGDSLFFVEKAGTVPEEAVKDAVPSTLQSKISWKEPDNQKNFVITEKQSEVVFGSGTYVYFPSNRAEVPYWLNRASIPDTDVYSLPNIKGQLKKPIYVEHGLDEIKKWLILLLVDTRCDLFPISSVEHSHDKEQRTLTQYGYDVTQLAHATQQRAVLAMCNEIIKLLGGNDSLCLRWRGRHDPRHFSIYSGNNMFCPSLDALSAGQSSLLSIFGTLIRYADRNLAGRPYTARDIQGICLVDEIDAHMHVDLQYRALPKLIEMFPKVQFIVSSHSPLFALGMEKTFGTNGLSIIEMPKGNAIPAEAYAEFARAFEVLQDTQAFAQTIGELAQQSGKTLVLLEGEIDQTYFETAIQLRESRWLLENVEFRWIGAIDPRTGAAFHTGKDALNQTYNFLRANPGLIKRRIILLYDNDANKSPEDANSLHIRSLPKHTKTRVKKGIENMLPDSCIPEEMYEEKDRDDGGSMKSLDKTKLCEYICETKHDAADFVNFAPVLDEIEQLAKPESVGDHFTPDHGI
ncbi:MAG: AAA family ATPase [Defluviicoccus sp.]|nr:AAA family ATPase [Defluviicoccus sp.]MDG4593395.1 AAA family ATPase [Defluviicoccus sp.]